MEYLPTVFKTKQQQKPKEQYRLYDVGSGNDFLGQTPKVQAAKANTHEQCYSSKRAEKMA